MELIEGTGVYIRTNENGTWESKDIACCSEQTQRLYLSDKDRDWLLALVLILLKKRIK